MCKLTTKLDYVQQHHEAKDVVVKKKRVHFSDNIESSCSCLIGELSEREKALVWYTKKDYDSFADNNMKDVALSMNHKQQQQQQQQIEEEQIELNYSIRGLEHKLVSKNSCAARKWKRWMHVQDVLEVQEDYYCGDDNNEKYYNIIANVAIASSKQAQKQAHQVAIRDAKIASIICNEIRSIWCNAKYSITQRILLSTCLVSRGLQHDFEHRMESARTA